MSQNVNSFFDTYIDAMKRYVVSLERLDDEMTLSFLKDDVDYYWDKLSAEEKKQAYSIISRFNKEMQRAKFIESTTEE